MAGPGARSNEHTPKRPLQQPAEVTAGKRRSSPRGNGMNKRSYDETKRRDNTTPPKTKRQKTIQYFEDMDKGGGGELKQLIKMGTYGIMAIERGRKLGDG